MRLLLDRLFEATMFLAGVFMVGTLLTVLSSICGRFYPPLGIAGADAYAGYCMAASAFLALASTLGRGEHIRVTLILERLPRRARRRLDIFCHLAALAISSMLAWYSVRLVRQSLEFNDISTGLDATPLWIPQIGMAVGTTVFAIAFAAQLFDLLSGHSRQRAGGDEPARVE